MIERIKHIEGLKRASLPPREFIIVHSAWLALMGLRQNGDLDLLISSRLRAERFSGEDASKTFRLPGELEKEVKVFPVHHVYGSLFGAKGIDDVIYNYYVEFDGCRFIEPRFYFEFKARRFSQNEVRQNRRWSWLPWLERLKKKDDSYLEKVIRVKKKDDEDFCQIDRFFSKGRYLAPEFRHVSKEAWGEWVRNASLRVKG